MNKQLITTSSRGKLARTLPWRRPASFPGAKGRWIDKAAKNRFGWRRRPRPSRQERREAGLARELHLYQYLGEVKASQVLAISQLAKTLATKGGGQGLAGRLGEEGLPQYMGDQVEEGQSLSGAPPCPEEELPSLPEDSDYSQFKAKYNI